MVDMWIYEVGMNANKQYTICKHTTMRMTTTTESILSSFKMQWKLKGKKKVLFFCLLGEKKESNLLDNSSLDPKRKHKMEQRAFVIERYGYI